MAGEIKTTEDKIAFEISMVQCIGGVVERELIAWKKLTKDMPSEVAASFARSMAEQAGVAKVKCLGLRGEEVTCDASIGYAPIGAIMARRASNQCIKPNNEVASTMVTKKDACNAGFDEILSSWLSTIEHMPSQQKAAYTEALARDLGLKPIKQICSPHWLVRSECNSDEVSQLNMGLITTHFKSTHCSSRQENIYDR